MKFLNAAASLTCGQFVFLVMFSGYGLGAILANGANTLGL